MGWLKAEDKNVKKTFLQKCFSVWEHSEQRILIMFLGIKIYIQKPKYVALRKKDPYYYYKKNNIDITKIPPATGRIRDIQLANFAILKEFDYVCKKNNLIYWLDWGTLLGAVRHKGFIPWDDDIDVAMPREYYEKVIEVFNKDTRNKDLYATYYRTFMKICHKKCSKLFVDIFPWDMYGKKLSPQEQLHRTSEIKGMCREFRNFLDIEHTESEYEKLRNEQKETMQKIVTNKNSTEYDEHGDYIWGIDYIHVEKNWFVPYEVVHPIKEIEFEGNKFPCLNDYNAYLTEIYGNYMSYPKKISLGHCLYETFNEEENKVILELQKNL